MQLGQIDVAPHLLTYHVQWPFVRTEFTNLLSSLTAEDLRETSVTLDSLKSIKLDDIVLGKGTKDLEEKVIKAKAYAERLGLDLESASQGSAFVNGKWYELNDVSLPIMVVMRVTHDCHRSS